MKNHHIMIIAGEASGDMRAAGLAIALKKLEPSIRLNGIGGTYMREAGVECFTDITELAVIGIAEVIKNFSRIKKVFEQTLKQIDATKPDAVVLVDYPGFNLRLAREIKKRGIKIIYYISPQVWAWREKRVIKIKELVDRMIVLFPFEQAIYSKYGMKVDYVGHPLVDEIIVHKNQTEVLKSIGLSVSKTTIGLMPGSRAKEVERHLPCMLEAAQILFKNNQDRQFILLKASSIPLKLIESIVNSQKVCHCEEQSNESIVKCHCEEQRNESIVKCHCEEQRDEAIVKCHCEEQRDEAIVKCHCEEQRDEAISNKKFPLKIYDGPTYDGINAMDTAIVASGTATLETALLKKPMVIIYKTSWLTYAFAKAVIKIPFIGLVNIVAGKKVAEELIQNDANAVKIANATESALFNQQTIEDLAAIKTLLGTSGASQRAAQVVLDVL